MDNHNQLQLLHAIIYACHSMRETMFVEKDFDMWYEITLTNHINQWFYIKQDKAFVEYIINTHA